MNALTMWKRSVAVSGRSTSVSMEDEFWWCFAAIANSRDRTVSELISEINLAKGADQNLSSACRVFTLMYFQGQAAKQTEALS